MEISSLTTHSIMLADHLFERLDSLQASDDDKNSLEALVGHLREFASDSMAREGLGMHRPHCSVFWAPAMWPQPCNCGAAIASRTLFGRLLWRMANGLFRVATRIEKFSCR